MESLPQRGVARKGATADPSAQSRQLRQQAIARCIHGLTHLELFEIMAGALIAFSAYILYRNGTEVPGWHLQFQVEDAFFAHFAGVPAVLAAGWAAMALKGLYARRWALGALALAACAVGISALMLIARSAGLDANGALVLGLFEACLAGFWAADLFGCLAHPRMTAAIALEMWILLISVLFFQPVLEYLFPMLVALLLTTPLLSAAVSRKLDVPSERVTLPFVALGMVSAPLAVAAAMILAHFWLPV